MPSVTSDVAAGFHEFYAHGVLTAFFASGGTGRVQQVIAMMREGGFGRSLGCHLRRVDSLQVGAGI